MPHAQLPRTTTWRKASRSNQEGACVEVADLPGAIGIRDSKHPGQAHLVVSRWAFAIFAAKVKADF
jgi:hypothetical protein